MNTLAAYTARHAFTVYVVTSRLAYAEPIKAQSDTQSERVNIHLQICSSAEMTKTATQSGLESDQMATRKHHDYIV